MAKPKTMLMRFSGRALARLIRRVIKTSKTVSEPADVPQLLRDNYPCIVACWHGQFMMIVGVHPGDYNIHAMVARHGDAELIGQAMECFGVELIRGAGAGGRKRDRGGAAALRASVTALKQRTFLVMTADVPPGPARVAGAGIVTVARLSGCPILPIACATTNFKSFDTWSRITVNLPNSKLAFVCGDPIHVPRDADGATLEALRLKVETGLNGATRRAYELAGADISRATPLDLLPPEPPAAPRLAVKTYRTVLSALRPAVPLLLGIRERQGKEDPARRNERLGIAARSRPNGRLVWVHAASVGETNAALPLIDEMLKRDQTLNVLLTTGTTTSAALAATRLPERAMHQFVPLDVVSYARRFLDHWKPDLAIFTESEIWPNLILETSHRTIPLALINARMSPRSMKRWRRHTQAARPLFSRFNLALAQNDKIARTLRALGVQEAITAGNLKVDAPPQPVDDAELARLQKLLGGRPHYVAASTHPGEEAIIAEAHRVLAKDVPNLLTIIVPRHPERGAELADSLARQGFKVARRSLADHPAPGVDIYIADTLGELGTFYALCTVALIGGSLVERGGQNPIEAVRHGAAILTGPHRHNFRDAYDALFDEDGAREVKTAADIASAIKLLLLEPKQSESMRRGAETALAGLSGALEITLTALKPYLDGTRGTKRAA